MVDGLKDKRPLISVLVPVYNIEKYIKHCLESIITQSYPYLQILLVDDGSTDNSGQICEDYARRDVRIRVVHKPNGGLVTARKAGLELAEGDYIGFVDGDDYIESGFYEKLLLELLKTDADFVHGGFVEERENGKMTYAPSAMRKINGEEDKIPFFKEHVLHIGGESELWTPSIWSKLFKADFIKKCYMHVPDELSYGEDMLAFCRCILESNQFILTPNAEYHYLIREDSISNQWSVNRFWQESNLCHELINIWIEYGYDNRMDKHMGKYFFSRMVNCMNQVNRIGLGTVKYMLPDIGVLEGKKLVVYGAGLVGRNYISQLLAAKQCSVVAWTDKNFQNVCYPLCIPRNRLEELEYDMILIAVKDSHVAVEIREELAALGVKTDKMVWLRPQLSFPDK